MYSIAADHRAADLQAELDKARVEADQLRSSAQKSTDLLTEDQENCKAIQARVAEAESNLSKCVTECDTLKDAKETDATEIRRLSQEHQEVTSQASVAKEELRQAAEIISGKPYLLQCVFGQRSFPGLTQVWRLPAAFPDLPRSAEEARQFFDAHPDVADEQQKLFWL